MIIFGHTPREWKRRAKEHKWFIGCQFHPEFSSKPQMPHPLFKAFINAAINTGK